MTDEESITKIKTVIITIIMFLTVISGICYIAHVAVKNIENNGGLKAVIEDIWYGKEKTK